MAAAVEYCQLHRRIALNAMVLFGTSPRLLMLGIMTPTAFLSMWISNTATTAMMCPIMDAVMEELHDSDDIVGTRKTEVVTEMTSSGKEKEIGEITMDDGREITAEMIDRREKELK